jgi:Fur family transcriptional regulator, peroxide stress response regulator
MVKANIKPADREQETGNEQELVTRFTDLCHQAGLKSTHQRLEIYRELQKARDHPSPEMLHKRVQDKMPTIALDTIYRTLATFEEHGMVVRVHAFDDHSRFDADLSPHHHCVCDRCKTVRDVRWEMFDLDTLPDESNQWGTIVSRHVVFRGICRDCLEKGSRRL